MAYSSGTQLNPAMAQRERELLCAGLSYTEVAAVTGGRIKSISERNRLIYKIDIWEAFERRVKRDGIPNRLTVPDAFGYWFSGLFDGEGTIIVFTRPCTGRPQYTEYRLGIRIQVRDDDAQMLYRIHDELKIGSLTTSKGHGHVNPTVSFRVERVEDLAEVVVPLFDCYPLHSKKAKEYAIWKPIVLQRYVSTLGGYSNRRAIPDVERAAFDAALKAFCEIRTYRVTLADVASEVAAIEQRAAAIEATNSRGCIAIAQIEETHTIVP